MEETEITFCPICKTELPIHYNDIDEVIQHLKCKCYRYHEIKIIDQFIKDNFEEIRRIFK